MKTNLNFAATAVSLIMLAGCVEESGSSSVTPGRATLAQVEQACVSRLAQEAGVSPSQVSVVNSTGSTEGTAVFLTNANGAPWVCRADGAGNITALEFQGEG